MKITKEDIRQFREEELKHNNELKQQLKTAVREDFQLLVNKSWAYPYAAAFKGHFDIANFKRKSDCLRFINSFPQDIAPETIKKNALIAAKRVLNHDDLVEEALFSGGFSAGVKWALNRIGKGDAIDNAPDCSTCIPGQACDHCAWLQIK